MTYIYMGRRDEGLAVAEKIVETLFRGPRNAVGPALRHRRPLRSVHHGHDYHDAFALWARPLALRGHDVRQGVQPGTLVHEVLTATLAVKERST
jgi:hypothetical protein